MSFWDEPYDEVVAKANAIEMVPDPSGVWVQKRTRQSWDVYVENDTGQFDFVDKADQIIYGVDYGTFDFYQDSDGRVIICDSEKHFHHNCDHDPKKGQR